MKKIFVLMLCVIMIFSLSACSEKEAIKEIPAVETAEETDVKPEKTIKIGNCAPGDKTGGDSCRVPDQAEAEESAAETAENGFDKAPSVLHFNKISIAEGGQLEDNTSVYSVRTDAILLTDDDAEKYPELQEALKKDFGEDRINTLKSDIIELFDPELTDREYIPELCNETSASFKRADSNLVSIIEDNYWYGGGAHPEESFFGSTYNAKTGEKLSLDDIVTDKDKLIDTVKTKLLENYEPDTFFDTDPDLECYKDGTCPVNWVLTYSGISVWFNHYEIAPYASGILSADISYDTPGLFKDGLAYEPENYVCAVPVYSCAETDGKSLFISTGYDDYGAMDTLNISYGDKEASFSTRTYTADPMLIRSGDKRFLYVLESGDDDETWMDMYSLTEDGIDFLGRQEGGEYCFESISYEPENTPENVYAWGRKNSFYMFTDPENFVFTAGKGTEGRTFRVGENGMPEAAE